MKADWSGVEVLCNVVYDIAVKEPGDLLVVVFLLHRHEDGWSPTLTYQFRHSG